MSNVRKHINGLVSAAFIALSLSATAVSASVMTYTGSDDGVLVTGPFANSDAAKASFVAATAGLGSLTTIDFEGQPLGFSSSFVAAPGVTIALSARDRGNDYRGIANLNDDTAFGFNTTVGGSKWLGFPEGSATFTFDSPIEAFGFYLTGLESSYYQGSVSVEFSGSSPQMLTVSGNPDGGVTWFGFTNLGNPFSSITISNLTRDAWGIDDVMFARARVATVPEPTILLLFGLGLAGLATSRRRRRS